MNQYLKLDAQHVSISSAGTSPGELNRSYDRSSGRTNDSVSSAEPLNKSGSIVTNKSGSIAYSEKSVDPDGYSLLNTQSKVTQ